MGVCLLWVWLRPPLTPHHGYLPAVDMAGAVPVPAPWVSVYCGYGQGHPCPPPGGVCLLWAQLGPSLSSPPMGVCPMWVRLGPPLSPHHGGLPVVGTARPIPVLPHGCLPPVGMARAITVSPPPPMGVCLLWVRSWPPLCPPPVSLLSPSAPRHHPNCSSLSLPLPMPAVPFGRRAAGLSQP